MYHYYTIYTSNPEDPFSSAHGLLTWISLVPLILSIQESIRLKVITILTWVFLFGLSLATYLIGYQKPSHHPETLFFLKQPFIFLKYIAAIIGAPIAQSLTGSIVFGFIILVSYLIFFKVLISLNKNTQLSQKISPWLSIGLFAILFALMTAIGRSGFGVEQALSSRYTTILNLLIISLIQMISILLCNNHFSLKNRFSVILGIGFSIGILISIFYGHSGVSILAGHDLRFKRSQGNVCLELIHYFDLSNPIPDCFTYIYPFDQAKILPDGSEKLEDLGFRDFPKNINFLEEKPMEYGYIDSPIFNDFFNVQKETYIKVTGWAILPEKEKQPKLVLLSYNDNEFFFATAPIGESRSDVSEALQSQQYKNSGWSINLNFTSFPIGHTVIKAWVYDRDTKEFVKLNGEVTLNILE